MKRVRLVQKECEWLERYTYRLFTALGYDEVEKNAMIEIDGIEHEFDVKAETNRGTLLIECKDVTYFDKKLVDTFIGKLRDYQQEEDENARGAFILTKYMYKDDENEEEPETEEEVLYEDVYDKYSNYCSRHGVTFLAAQDIEALWDLQKEKDKEEAQEKIEDFFGFPKEERRVATNSNWFWELLATIVISIIITGVIMFFVLIVVWLFK